MTHAPSPPVAPFDPRHLEGHRSHDHAPPLQPISDEVVPPLGVWRGNIFNNYCRLFFGSVPAVLVTFPAVPAFGT